MVKLQIKNGSVIYHSIFHGLTNGDNSGIATPPLFIIATIRPDYKYRHNIWRFASILWKAGIDNSVDGCRGAHYAFV